MHADDAFLLDDPKNIHDLKTRIENTFIAAQHCSTRNSLKIDSGKMGMFIFQSKRIR